MVFNEEKLLNFLKTAPNGSEVKIFFYIAFNQPQTGIYGFRTTKQQLEIDLQLKRSTIFAALQWLEKNLLIDQLKLAEDFDFMANPYFVMNNADRDERIAEWSRRCRIKSMKIVAKRKAKLKSQ